MEDSQHSALTKEGVVESLHVCISVCSFQGGGLEYMCSLFLEDTKRRGSGAACTAQAMTCCIALLQLKDSEL